MASSSSFLPEDQLLCSICLDVFTDPVSTPCGHNFCMVCLRDYWNSSSHYKCPLCKEEFSKRPELRVNTLISGLTAQFKKSVQVKPSSSTKQQHCQKHERPLKLFCRDDQIYVCLSCAKEDHKNHRTVPIEEESAVKKSLLVRTQAEIQQMIQDRLKKIEKLKHSVELNKRNTEKEISDSVEMFSALVRCIEKCQAELLKLMEEKQNAAERQAEEFIKELEQEITELKRRDAELEQLSHTEDHVHLQIDLSLYSSAHNKNLTNWSDININTQTWVETLSHLQDSLQKEMDKLSEIKLKTIQQYTVDVTLDPDTAHRYLILSDDGKQVKLGDTPQNLPDNPKRFSNYVCVLGKEGFTSGRFYYEVQVRGKTEWDLGVTTESSNRKGEFTLRPENGYWRVCLRNETEYKALDASPLLLSLKHPPQKVGVFVDYEEGLVSFYNVEARSRIYSFTCQSFTEKLYPFFSPSLNDGGKNSAPLIITPVKH